MTLHVERLNLELAGLLPPHLLDQFHLWTSVLPTPPLPPKKSTARLHRPGAFHLRGALEIDTATESARSVIEVKERVRET